ncbi:hypothetical protein [Peribacillus sp. Hz7]|uniref:hypothetical protein n=1 Tax=Peribacillus sp. Hz7 TaxID=3344873 RepID=UPI0035CB751B
MTKKSHLSNAFDNLSDNTQEETKVNQTQETKQITSEETVIENTNAEQQEAIQETVNGETYAGSNRRGVVEVEGNIHLPR